MPKQNDVKIFISWSGPGSKAIASVLRKRLPVMFDRVRPWMSDTDIAPGQRGMVEIQKQLRSSQFGIIVVTDDNQQQPWLNFEAGALSNALPKRAGVNRVVPLLVDLKSPSDLHGPLAQFQAVTLNHDGIKALAYSIAKTCGIQEFVAEQRFALQWRLLWQETYQAYHQALLPDDPVPQFPSSETGALSWEEQQALQAMFRTTLDKATSAFVRQCAEELGVQVWRAYRSEQFEITILMSPMSDHPEQFQQLKATLSSGLDSHVIVKPWSLEDAHAARERISEEEQ